MTAATQNTLDLIQRLTGSAFWGTLTLKFQHGQIIHITKEESIQPQPEHRKSYDQHSN